MMDDDQEYLIIRNSKSSTTNNNVQYYCSKIDDDAISVTSSLDDETPSLHNGHASLSIVRLVESSDGNYMLDFGDDNSPVVTSFLSDHTCSSYSSSDDYKTFIQSHLLKYLTNFAELVRVELPSNADAATLLKDELDDHDKSALLIDHFGSDNFHRLPDDINQVLRTLLPLESLFSWPYVAKARDEGYINWKDIRFFLTQAKRGAPFMITAASEGALQHIVNTHITFQQFVIFARLVEHHLQKLPCVRVSVHQTSTLSVDIQLRSDQNCTVRIGLMNENDCEPTARQFTEDDEGSDNTFISFECIQLAAGDKKIVRLGGLKSSTVFKSYIHISKVSLEFHVQSTDGDVLKSLLIVETQDYHLIDIFSKFSLMTKEEQRIELMASIKDKSVRIQAQADGLVIPDVEEEPGDNCSEAWRLYLEWWQDALDTRYDFCVRELLYASKDQGVRRNYAQQDGIIAMNQSRSKDRVKREQWMRAFGSWYYHRDTATPATGNTDSQSTFRKDFAQEEMQYQSVAPVQTLNLSKSEVSDESSMINRLIPTFQGKANQQEAKDETAMENYTNSLGVQLLLKAQGIACPTSSLPEMTLEVTDLTSKLPADVVMPSKHESSPPPQLLQNRCEEKKIPIRWPENDALQEASTRPPKRPSKSRLTIGVVGQVVSFRQRFLRRLSARIDTCLVQLRPKTPSSLRGIALFRAKVRLVMLLQKVSKKPFSSLNDVDIFSYQQRNTRSATPKAVTPSLQEEEDDDLPSMEMATDHCKDKVARKVFTYWRTWTRGLVAEKRAQEERKMLAAMEAFSAFLLRKYFRAFVEAVKTDKEATTEEEEPPIVDLENFCMNEDEECCVFTTSWKTGVDMYCRIDRSSSTWIDHQQLITQSSNQRRFNMLDKDQLRSMRRAKSSGATNLYDVPESLCRFDDLTDEKRPLYRAREIAKSIVSTKA